MRRKPQSRAAKKAAATRAAELKKAKFWVPPSLAKDGGKPKAATKKKAKPKPKFWTPEQLGLQEREWEGGAGTRHAIEEENGRRLVWYWHGDSEPGGLCVTGLLGHEKRISVYKNDPSRAKYGDPVLDELDPVSSAPAVGYCHSCESSRCYGVKWACERLLKRNPLPF